MFNFHCRTTRV